jgi:hypothetical protein
MALKRIFVGGGLNALRGLEGLTQLNPEDVKSLEHWLESKGVKKPMPTPKPNRLSSRLYAALGETPDSLQAQNLPEQILQSLVASTPLAAQGLASAGKQGIKNAVKGVLAGQATKAGLSAAGAPESVQNIGQVAAEGIVGYRGSKKAHGTLEEHRDTMYQKARESLKDNNMGETSPRLKKFLKKSDSIYRTETDSKVRQEVSDIINTIKSNVFRDGNVNIENLWDTNKSLGKQYTKASPGLRTYITEARKGIEDTLLAHSAANPSFSKYRPSADDLHKYLKGNNVIKDYFKDIPLKGLNPLTYVKASGIPAILDKLESVGRAAFNPAVRRYYAGLTNAVIKNNAPSAIRYAGMLSNKVESMGLPEDDWREVIDENDEWTPVEE